MSTETWKWTDGGYEMAGASLVKSRGCWVLTWNHHTVDLGRKATFDHAERELVRLGFRGVG